MDPKTNYHKAKFAKPNDDGTPKHFRHRMLNSKTTWGLNGPEDEKTHIRTSAHNKDSNQPVYPRILSGLSCPHEKTLPPRHSNVPVKILINLCACVKSQK